MKTVALTAVIIGLVSLSTFAGPEPIQASGNEMKTTVAPPVEEFSWTGFYVGLRLGYGWHDGDIHSELVPGDFFMLEPAHQNNDSDGITGGGQVGYNWQFGRFVLGAEADISAADINGESHPDVAFAPSNLPASQTFRHEIDWFGTVRLRGGFTPVPRLFIYGTGGFAWANIEQTAGVITVVTNYVNSRSTTEIGGTGGGGIEYALGDRWSIKAEYLYICVGDSSVTAAADNPQVPFVVKYDWDNSFHSFTFGVNYRF